MDLIIKWLMMFAIAVTFLAMPNYGEAEAEGDGDSDENLFGGALSGTT